jgi:hypothetical protein
MRKPWALITRSMGAAGLVLALAAVPNLLWRDYGFDGGVGFPLAYQTWRDAGWPSSFFHWPMLVANITFIVLAAGATAILVWRDSAMLMIAPRSLFSLFLAAPWALDAWITRGSTTCVASIIATCICLWSWAAPGRLAWILVFGLHFSITFVSFPAAMFLSDNTRFSNEIGEWAAIGIVWLICLIVTYGLYRLRPRRRISEIESANPPLHPTGSTGR